MSRKRPNLLFILADQFRADAISAISSYASTPHLDGLAAKGALFRRAYCNSPECVPSRFSFALGQYPHQTGIWRNRLATLNPACPNWMQAIAAAGYRTSLFGKTHLHPHSGDLREREPLMHALGLEDVDETPGPRASMSCLSHMTAGWEKKGVWDAYRRDFEPTLRILCVRRRCRLRITTTSMLGSKRRVTSPSIAMNGPGAAG